MTHDRLDSEALELAALYAVGGLADDERRRTEERFAASPAFWDEVRSLERTAHEMFADGPERDAPPEVLARLRARMDEPLSTDAAPAPVPQIWKDWVATGTGNETVVPGDGDAFEPTSIEGIVARRLFVDRDNDRITMMVRMEPGTSYPPHRHGGAEECYVLEGDLRVGDGVRLKAGDYQRMAEGSFHPRQSTEGGCTLLLISSARDEVLDG